MPECSCLLKTVKHMVLQRLCPLGHLCSSPAVASLDAAAWDEQHTEEKLKIAVDLVIVVITRFDKAKGGHFQAIAEKLDDAQRRKLVIDKDVTYSVDGSLFPGEGLTQIQSQRLLNVL